MPAGMPVVVVILVLFLAAYGVRMTYKQRPAPRQKAGESAAETRVIVLGTFRVYTWLVWLSVALGIFGLLAPGFDGFDIAALISGAILMLVAHALYWRLGYDSRRWLFVIAHLSGAFAIAELSYALQHDIRSFAKED